MSNSFFSLKLDAWRSLLEAFISFHQAAILAKERRQAWSNIVATLRIIANVQGNVRDRFGRLVGQYVISRSLFIPARVYLQARDQQITISNVRRKRS